MNKAYFDALLADIEAATKALDEEEAFKASIKVLGDEFDRFLCAELGIKTPDLV